jgi:hypothetical protein
MGVVISGEVEEFNWMQKYFPKVHKHPNTATSAVRSTKYINATIPLNENSTPNMCKILDQFVLTFLEGRAEKAKDPAGFKKDVKMVQDSSVAKEERQAAEGRIMVEVKEQGELFFHGDLLTLERIECAKKARSRSVTIIENLSLVKTAWAGGFHTAQNKLVTDYKFCMTTDKSIEDRLSLAHLSIELGMRNVSGTEEDIKKNYEAHKQFFIAAGKCSIVSCFTEFLKTEVTEVEKTKEGAMDLVTRFLETSKFLYWHDTSRTDMDFYDDLERNCVNLASRTLIHLIIEQVHKAADGRGIRAVKLALVPYLLNRSVVQNSKYARWLFVEYADFNRLSDRDKWRVDRYCTVNTSGRAGDNVPHDMSNEHLIGKLKTTISAMWSKLSMQQLEKSVLGLNVMTLVKDLDREVMGMEVGTGGGHSSARITDEQKIEMKELFQEEKPFCIKPPEDGGREKVEYVDQPDMKCWWEGKVERAVGSSIIYEDNLSDYNKKRFLERGMENYVKSRCSRLF